MENVWGDDVLFQGPSLDRRPMTFYPVVRIENGETESAFVGHFQGSDEQRGLLVGNLAERLFYREWG